MRSIASKSFRNLQSLAKAIFRKYSNKNVKMQYSIQAAALALLWLTPTALPATTLLFYSVAKGTFYHQDPGGSPAVRPYAPWFFKAQAVFDNNPDYFISASVILPNLQTDYLAPSIVPDKALTHFERTNTQPNLDSNFTNGVYKFQFFISGHLLTGSNVMAGGSLPPAPAIANLTDAQSINPSNDFALTWNSFTGGSTNDFIICSLQSGIGTTFQTSIIPGATNALNGTANSILIPAKTLSPGRSYFGRLVFAKVQSTVTNQIPGAFGATLYTAQTDFYVKTQGSGDATPPIFLSSIPANGAVAVPTNVPVVFSFNKGMNGGWSFRTAVGDPRIYNGSWNQSKTRLAFLPSTNFSGNQTYAFILNPLDSALAFADANQNLLPPDTVISFATGNSQYQSQTPLLTSPRAGTGGMLIDLLGTTNTQCVLQSSTNLNDWYPLATNTVFVGTVNFTDTNSSMPNCFYRTIGY